MTITPGGAQFEISVDGKPRSYRDIKAVAIASAEFLNRRNPNSNSGERPADRRSHPGGIQAAAGMSQWRSPCARPALATASTRTIPTSWCIPAGGKSAASMSAGGFPDDVRWSWSLYGVVFTPRGINTDGHAPTLEAAKGEFGANWKQCLA